MGTKSYAAGRLVAGIQLRYTIAAVGLNSFGVRALAPNANAGGVGILGWDVYLDDDITNEAGRTNEVTLLWNPIVQVVTTAAPPATATVSARVVAPLTQASPAPGQGTKFTVYMVQDATGSPISADAVAALIETSFSVILSVAELGADVPPAP